MNLFRQPLFVMRSLRLQPLAVFIHQTLRTPLFYCRWEVGVEKSAAIHFLPKSIRSLRIREQRSAETKSTKYLLIDTNSFIHHSSMETGSHAATHVHNKGAWGGGCPVLGAWGTSSGLWSLTCFVPCLSSTSVLPPYLS